LTVPPNSTFHLGSGPSEGNDEPGHPPEISALAVQRDGSILVAATSRNSMELRATGSSASYGDPTTPLELSITQTVSDSPQLHLTGTADIAIIESARNLSPLPIGSPQHAIPLSQTNVVSIPANQSKSFYRARPIQ
jgi:hypothetical protein